MHKILVSVIIPTRNRLSSVKKLLSSFNEHHKTSFGWEILIIDNMSNDGTEEYFKGDLPYNFKIRYFREENLGLHYCRHRGAFEAKGEVIAYLDDDMIVSPNWLNGATLIFENKADMVIGRILPKWETVPPLWVNYFYKNGRSDYLGLLDLGLKVKKANVVFGGNFFIRKKLLFELGGFGPDGFPKEYSIFRGNGEGKLWLRFLNKRYKCYYNPVSSVLHVIDKKRLTIENFSNKVYNAEISRYVYRLRIKNKIEKKKNMNFFLKIIRKIHEYILKFNSYVIYKRLNKEDKEIIKKIVLDNKNKFYGTIKKIENNQEILDWLLKKDYFDFDFDYLKIKR